MEMTSRERVLTAFARSLPDRVPLNYFANPGLDGRVKARLGLAAADTEGLLGVLGVDFRRVQAPYAGPPLHPRIPGRQVDAWGIRRQWVEHATGGYWEYCDFPLRDADLETVERWPMPSPDAYDYDAVRSARARWPGLCLVAGGTGSGDILNKAGMIRGVEQTLIDLATDDPAFLRWTDRRHAVELEVLRRTLEAARGAVDVLWIGEDLGTQHGPLIGRELFRRHLRPRLQRFVDLGRAAGIPVMIHSCGSSRWAFDEFVAMGIAVVDTLQPEARGMAPADLKRDFGGCLAFHGGISTAGAVARGTPTDVAAEVRRTLEVMMPGGGYALAPAHLLQDNSPVENVLALYQAARTFGTYGTR